MNLQDVCAISVVGVDKHDLMWMKNAAKEACGNPFSRVHVSWQIPALLPCALLRHLYTKSLEDLRELISFVVQISHWYNYLCIFAKMRWKRKCHVAFLNGDKDPQLERCPSNFLERLARSTHSEDVKTGTHIHMPCRNGAGPENFAANFVPNYAPRQTVIEHVHKAKLWSVS